MNNLQRIDRTTWLALGGVAAGWFAMNMFVASFGPAVHAIHFYEMPAAVRDPLWLLWGSGEVRLSSIAFALVCLMVIAAPTLPYLGYRQVPWLLSSAPLLLMVLCSIVLYVKASSARIEAPQSMGAVGGFVARLANSAASWSGDVVARHVAIGAGCYLSFLASAVLAVRGITARREADSFANMA